ncbi:MAG: DEAD/DEAH box helicase family protein [Bacteroidales bacterium]|nr:DEAD/DEAH box helicase family protein [Lachnoclostridium sp.]MCM1383376.1 DEAD/DEAH box helicase family protein [Lachnoclostridium sp.]MCM1464224.1 DEAD/DEAH box helicase family protein [Bacteroidales bacterium]
MTSIAELEKRIQYLEQENRYLKNLLAGAGIAYSAKATDISGNTYDPNQGARIIPRNITETEAKLFFSMFWGRTDVYSRRTIKKSTGEVNYYTQCYNFWKKGCPRINGSKIKCQDCPRQAYKELRKEQIIDHLRGNAEDATDVIGVFPLLTDDTCRFIVFDFDNHEKDAEKSDFANVDDRWKDEVDSLRKICDINGIDALVERSRSGKGAHLWIFFQKPIEAGVARKFGNALLNKGAESVNLKSFRFYDRMLPMQNHLPKGGVGNLIALPLQGQALKEGNSAFIDEYWNAYSDQWEVLLNKKKLSKEFVEDKIKEWTEGNPDVAVEYKDIFESDSEKPWDKTKHFQKGDVEGVLHIILSNGVYVDTANLQPRIQNQIRRLAAFSNPVFYKNQVMGLSNFENYRYIYLGSDEDGFIKVPRGILEDIIEECERAGIEYEIEDIRSIGCSLHVKFLGELKEPQMFAVEKLLQYDNGILNAATAFGKTVVCCNIIAKKQVNTLILLQSSTLMEQWQEALEKFLFIDEELPEYETPTGRKKKRKSLIGKLQGAHDSTTGIIDIAMVGSICKNGEYHKRLKEYGLILVDECHHAASDTIADILQEANAKYIYGVTATPFRGDGLEKINYMLLGPIRYRYTSKDRAKEQGIEHLVYPRFTRVVAPRFSQDKLHPNEAYEIIRNNEERDELIIKDVKQCVADGRTPVVLSKYVEHSRRLYQRLIGYADKVFLLSGSSSKKEHKEILKQMNQVTSEESMILVATGKLIGEGFDYPRLDTLVMATPVAWKGVVEQYAGRLNRDYVGKKSVIIYDYVDSHISMFDRMYHKRLKAYKQIGYNILSGTSVDKQTTNAIFDIDSYLDIYRRDLLTAEKEIIISSPAISGKKVYDIIHLLKEKQEEGIKIVIVTWNPDSYGYGDSAYWQELQEQMRLAGFEMNLVEDYCQHYCIIDRKVVWYGSMNFLGKEDAEDNLMRVANEEIANELLEMTFGNKQ